MKSTILGLSFFIFIEVNEKKLSFIGFFIDGKVLMLVLIILNRHITRVHI